MKAAASSAVQQLRTSAAKSYEPNKHRLLVIGGNGFVGSNIVQRAVQKGIEVRSLNKSGKPQWQDVPWIDQVEWHQGDVFNADEAAKAVDGVTGVISTVGAFGSNELMQRMCGDATIAAARAAQKGGTRQKKEKAAKVSMCSGGFPDAFRGVLFAGAERFVFISNSRVGSYVPTWAPLYGYYNGKERAEAAVVARFPKTGVSLRPGFIYGLRRTKSYSIPLQLAGIPMTALSRNLGAVSSVISHIPFFGEEMRAAIPVSAVAKAAVLSAIGPVHGQTLDTTNMLELADSFHNTL